MNFKKKNIEKFYSLKRSSKKQQQQPQKVSCTVFPFIPEIEKLLLLRGEVLVLILISILDILRVWRAKI